MNQYSTITSRLPVIPNPPPVGTVPTANQSSTNDGGAPIIVPSTFIQSTASTSAIVSPLPSTSAAIPGQLSLGENEQKITTNIESDGKHDIPSTSKDSLEKAGRIDDDLVKIEDLGSEEHIDLVKINATSNNESSETSELRRRRLQKFLKSEQTKD